MHDIVLTLAGIAALAIFCQWLAWIVKLPAILFLLLAGIVVGPWAGWLQPDELFGHLLFPLISLSVAIILFEGSLTLRFEEIAGVEKVVRRLVSNGLLVTWAITTLATYYLLAFPWELALLFGALAVVTGPTVIVPMLRSVRPTARVANILRWEGIIIDPVGALLAVLVFEFILAGLGGRALGHTLVVFGKVVVIGLGLGVAAGYLLGVVLRRHWLPEYLHNLATLSLVFAVFAASNALEHESGLLTVTVMGIWLANMRGVSIENILDFKESLSLLIISGLFIILAARIDFADFERLGWAALAVFLVLQFLARPLKVMVASWGSSLTWRERGLLAWIAPRGIVAAAVSAVFALRLQQNGYENADLLVPLTFLVIIGTVVLQSTTARGIAQLLKVAEPEPRGLLIVGANAVARAIAQALEQKGFRSVLVDSNWSNIRSAKLAGLATYYGNAVSEHADRHLDLVGIGTLLALTPHQELNALAALRYRPEFGRKAVYQVTTSSEEATQDKRRIASSHAGRTLFGDEVSYATLATLLSEGAKIHATNLTVEFDFDAYYKKYYRRATPLFAISPGGELRPFVAGEELHPGAGWTVLGLVSKASEEAADAAAGQDEAEH